VQRYKCVKCNIDVTDREAHSASSEHRENGGQPEVDEADYEASTVEDEPVPAAGKSPGDDEPPDEEPGTRGTSWTR
jgi:hypothetical protein